MRYITLLLPFLLIVTRTVAFLPAQILDGRGSGIGVVQRTVTPILLGKIPNLQEVTAINSTGVKKPLDKQQTVLHMSVSGGAESFPSFPEKVSGFVKKNSFLVAMALAVAAAKVKPSLGASGGILRPELFIGKFGVTCIFLLSGLSLELSELQNAITNFKLNILVQFCSFLAWPFLIGLPLTFTLKKIVPSLLPPTLLDGILVLTCLPTTVNMCVLLTGTAGGNVASSLCNAIIGNVMGIFATPALLMFFLGTAIELPFVQMVIKLCNKVLLPVAIGQGLRKTSAKSIYTANKKVFKSLQEAILIGIVWNSFSNTFTKGIGIQFQHGLALLAILSTLHVGSFVGLYKFFQSRIVKFNKEDTIAAAFCASHKTLAFGLPLLNTVFEGNPNLASYCAPIMFIHPLQLLLGTIFAEKLNANDKED